MYATLSFLLQHFYLADVPLTSDIVEQTGEISFPTCPLVPSKVEYACETSHFEVLRFAAIVLHVVGNSHIGKRQMKETNTKSAADHLCRQCTTLLGEDRR